MVTKTFTFHMSEQEEQRFLTACKNKNIAPEQAFEEFLSQFTQYCQEQNDETLRAKKLAYAGALAQYANPDLIPLEEKAVEMAIKEKYGVH